MSSPIVRGVRPLRRKAAMSENGADYGVTEAGQTTPVVSQSTDIVRAHAQMKER